MSHVIANQTQVVSVSTGYFNHPVQQGMDRAGDWYTYVPVDAGNTQLGASIVPYRWGTALPLKNAASELQIEGTIAIVKEVVGGVNKFYHGSTTEYIGAGVNDITNALEDDAFFFNHLGSLSPATDDNAFYWDRAFLPAGGSEWDFYQYHKHLPTFYPTYENGRLVMNGGLYIKPNDKAYASLIHTNIKVASVNYQSVLARIHTPSVGGAHNSHNDVTLPTISNKNYMMGGIIKGSGDRFHAFYLTADGAQWRVYNRTYVDANASFTAEVDLGVFDLADPTLVLGSECYNYPLRTSAGDLLGTKIYFPVILNNSVSGYDLEIWSFNSLDTIAGGSLERMVLLSGQTNRPDCQLCVVGTHIYAVISGTNNGGVELYVYADHVWEAATSQVLTNSPANILRVHGLRYNTEDVKFYFLVSGTSSGTGTYVGDGLYSFQIAGDYTGYPHLDYDSNTNSFIVRGPLSAGHLIHTSSNGVITRSSATEPQGIGSSVRVLTYEVSKPTFYNKTVLDLGGDEYIYHGITLENNKKFLAGRIDNLPYGTGRGDLLVSIVNQDNVTVTNFAYGGITGDAVCPIVPIRGDDYITAAFQSKVDPNKVWITGYTKSEMVPKRDMYLHGFCRSTVDDPNFLSWDDVVIDSIGNIYVIGTNLDGYANIAKYCSSYILRWQKQISYDFEVSGKSIAIDSAGYLYVSGNVNDGSAMVAKLDQNGNSIWIYSYATIGNTESTSSICVTNKNGVDYVVTAINTGANTTFVVLDTDGTIVEQKSVTDLTVNRVRNNISTTNGRVLFAGKNSANGTFGCYEILTSGDPVLWQSTYQTEAFDIVNVDEGPTFGYAVCGKSNTNAFVVKVTAVDNAGTWTVTKSWAKRLESAEFTGITATHYSEATRQIYVVGRTPTGGSAAMGMDEGLITAYSSTGTLLWQNVFGHDMHEKMTSVVMDITGRNIITTGWSRSHSNSQDAIVFRCDIGGYGTGVYHLNGNAGVPYYYVKTALVDASIAANITNLTVPTTTTGSIVSDTLKEFLYDDSGAQVRIFDGSYGENGTFMLFVGYFDLKKAQEYLNTQEYKDNVAAGRKVNYASDVFTFWQVATVGDGFADDGNVFGYDIIESSDSHVYVIGQTSGDLTMTNTGESGVYDYVLLKLDPVNDVLELYQNGEELDEETYALCELADGRIAFTGRTSGDLGDPNQGGYDIFLGIYNPTNDQFQYFSTGTGLDDRGMNIHDIGNNTLAIVYSSYGEFPGTTNTGSEDIGVILFNYSTNTWGTAYQTGTNGGDIFNQNGNPSEYLGDGRIAIAFSTAGIFDTESSNQGFLDLAVAVLDINTGTWTKVQVGSQSSEISTSLSAKGEKLLLSGFINDTFAEEGQAIYVETDVSLGITGKSAVT